MSKGKNYNQPYHIADAVPRILLEDLSSQQNVVLAAKNGALEVDGYLEAKGIGENLWNYFLNRLYPVGSIYTTTTLDTAEKVAEKLGGKWKAYGSGRVLVGAGEGYSAGTENGKIKDDYSISGTVEGHKLTVTEMPQHNHSVTANATLIEAYSPCNHQGCPSSNKTHFQQAPKITLFSRFLSPGHQRGNLNPA